MPAEPSLRATLALAALAHAGLLGLSTLFSASSPEPRPGPRAPASELEIDLAPLRPAPKSAEPRGDAPPAPSEVATSTRAKRPGHRDRARVEPPAPRGREGASAEAGRGEGEPWPIGEAGDPSPETREPGLSLEQLGIEGGGRVGLTLAPTMKSPRRRRSVAPGVERSMAEAVARRDETIGLGPGGPILSALERATHTANTPENARALFVASIDSGGNLRTRDVVSVTRDHRAWQRVARRALSKLRGRKLKVPQGFARGARLRIALESRIQLPSGADPGLGVSLLGLPLKEGDGDKSPRIDILKPTAKVEMMSVPTPGGKSYRMPVPAIGFQVLSVAADPADVGAAPRRVVHAHVVDQTPL